MLTVGTFQIRTFQATDIGGMFNFHQYFVFRIITVCVMIISSYGYILIRGYSGEKAAVVMTVCLFRAVDAMADVYEGWFQQKERLDLSGKALTYRILVAFVGFGISLVATHNILIACLMLTFSYMICYITFDIRYYNTVVGLKDYRVKGEGGCWMLRMVSEGAPLFINAFLITLIMNVPKMVLDTAIGQGVLEEGTQTIFNILFMPASFLNLAYIVFRPLITKMAVMWNVGKEKEFTKILRKIGVSLFVIGVIIFAGSALLGIPVLSFVYAVDLAKYKTELLTIIVGGCVYTFAAVLDNVLVIIRMQHILVFSYAITYLYIKTVAKSMVSCWGILGGALSYTTAMIVFFIVTAIMATVCFCLCKKKKNLRG